MTTTTTQESRDESLICQNKSMHEFLKTGVSKDEERSELRREECEVKKQIDMNYTLTPFRIVKV